MITVMMTMMKSNPLNVYNEIRRAAAVSGQKSCSYRSPNSSTVKTMKTKTMTAKTMTTKTTVSEKKDSYLTQQS